MDHTQLRCWAEIDLDALANNHAVIRRKAAGAAVMAVVKADAYGHGDIVIAHYLSDIGAADWFAVSCLPEAERLRRAGIRQPILILGYTPPHAAARLVEMDLVQTVPDMDFAYQLDAAAAAAGVRVQVHLALDTGMGRIGFAVLSDADTANEQLRECCGLSWLNITGAFTHFCVADSDADEDIAYTDAQHAVFLDALRRLRDCGAKLQTVHCCNSAALFSDAVPRYDLVRPGIVQYGLAPSPERAPFCHELRPALCLKARVAMVKTLKKGEYVSYGRTFCAPQDMRIATVTAGYADGYPRGLSNKGVCSIHGRPAPQIGNVCMDQLMLDVSDIPGTRAGDIVTLFGGEAADTIDAVAQKTGTINYTVICGLTRRVPRLYRRNGAEVAHTDYLED